MKKFLTAIFAMAVAASVATAGVGINWMDNYRVFASTETDLIGGTVGILDVASSLWQQEMPADHFIRHPSGKNIFDLADVCIDDYNPVGDAIVTVPGLETPIAPVSNIVDFTIAHWLEIETVRQCVAAGITPPVWNSANTPGSDSKNAAYVATYKPRIKSL